MLTVDLQPLCVAEDAGFRAFSAAAECRFILPARSTIRRTLIPNAYHQAASRLKTLLAQQATVCTPSCSSVHLTTDAWTSRTNKSFITYTVHYVDEEFRIQSYVIATVEFRDTHTSENLKSHAIQTLTKWVLCKKGDPGQATALEVMEPDLRYEYDSDDDDLAG